MTTPTTPPPDELLRPSDVARALGVHTETIRRWLRKGIIAHERVGPYRQARIRRSVMEQLRDTRPGAAH